MRLIDWLIIVALNMAGVIAVIGWLVTRPKRVDIAKRLDGYEVTAEGMARVEAEGEDYEGIAAERV